MYIDKKAETLDDFKDIVSEQLKNIQLALEKLEDLERNGHEMNLMDRFEIRNLVQDLKLVYQGDEMSMDLFKMVFDKTAMEKYFDCFKIASHCSLGHKTLPIRITFDDFDKSVLIQYNPSTNNKYHKSEEWYNNRLHELSWLESLRNASIEDVIKRHKHEEDIFSRVYILREIAERKSEIKNPIIRFKYRNKIRYALDKDTNSQYVKKLKSKVKSYEFESVERKEYLEKTLNPIINKYKDKLEWLGFEVEVEEDNWLKIIK